MKPSGPIPCLDGLRAIAVLVVFLSHAGLNHIVPGDLGVTVFFVLSGYLITTLLRQELARNDGIAVLPFYLRRALRLYPPLLMALLLALAISLAGLSTSVHWNWAGVLSVLFYFGNYWMILAGPNAGLPTGLGITWSLAVEEHFYLVYPLLAAPLLRLAPTPRTISLLVLCIGFSLWRVLLYYGFDASEDYLKMATDARIDAILYGCLLGAVANPWIDSVARRRPLPDLLLAVAAGVLLFSTLLVRDPVFREVARNGLRAAALAPLLYLIVLYGNHWLTAPLRWAPVVYIGEVSYLLYLAHDQILIALRDSTQGLAEWQIGVLGLALTLLVCELGRRYVERPVARLRTRLRR